MCAKLARFYGWTPDVIDKLDSITCVTYWEAITVIDAQETLINMRVADHPTLKSSARTKFHRSIIKRAYPKTFDPNEKQISTTEFAERLGVILNG